MKQKGKRIQEYILCILFHLLFPLLPLLFEYWSTRSISGRSLTIIAALYAITIGISSKNRAIFGLALFGGFILSVAYGARVADPKSYPGCEIAAIIVIFFILIAHGIERYIIHIKKGEYFWVL